MPRRSRPVYFPGHVRTTYQPSLTLVVSGIILVGAIGAISIWGFVRALIIINSNRGEEIVAPSIPQNETPRSTVHIVKPRPETPRTTTATSKPQASKVSTNDRVPSSRPKPKPAIDGRKEPKVNIVRSDKPINVAPPPRVVTPPRQTQRIPEYVAEPRRSIAPEVTSPRVEKAAPAQVWISAQQSAQIFVDGRYIGTTVDDTFNSGWKSLPAGRHEIELRRPQFKTLTMNIELKPGERRRFTSLVLEKGMANSTYPLRIQSAQTPMTVTITNLSDKTQSTINVVSSPYTAYLARGHYRLRLTHKEKVVERSLLVPSAGSSLIVPINFEKVGE